MKYSITDFKKFLVIACQPKTDVVTEEFKEHFYEQILTEVKNFLPPQKTDLSELRFPFFFIYSKNIIYIVFCFNLYHSQWENVLMQTLKTKANQFQIKPTSTNWSVDRKKDNPTLRDLRSAHGVYKQLTRELNVKKLSLFSTFFTDNELANSVATEPRNRKQRFKEPVSFTNHQQTQNQKDELLHGSAETLQRLEKKIDLLLKKLDEPSKISITKTNIPLSRADAPIVRAAKTHLQNQPQNKKSLDDEHKAVSYQQPNQFREERKPVTTGQRKKTHTSEKGSLLPHLKIQKETPFPSIKANLITDRDKIPNTFDAPIAFQPLLINQQKELDTLTETTEIEKKTEFICLKPHLIEKCTLSFELRKINNQQKFIFLPRYHLSISLLTNKDIRLALFKDCFIYIQTLNKNSISRNEFFDPAINLTNVNAPKLFFLLNNFTFKLDGLRRRYPQLCTFISNQYKDRSKKIFNSDFIFTEKDFQQFLNSHPLIYQELNNDK